MREETPLMAYQGALLLDLDSTLLDTAADFIHVIQSMQKEDGIEATDAQHIRNTVSNGARALVRLAWRIDDDHPSFQTKLDSLLDRYEEELGNNAQLFSGFDTLLPSLEEQRIAWAIVTNKPWRFTEPLLHRLHIQASSNVVICPDHVTHRKPHAEPLLLAAEQLQLTAKQCIYAGDHRRDIESAQNANMKSIACGFGYIPEDDDIKTWNASIIANNVNELGHFVKNYFKIK